MFYSIEVGVAFAVFCFLAGLYAWPRRNQNVGRGLSYFFFGVAVMSIVVGLWTQDIDNMHHKDNVEARSQLEGRYPGIKIVSLSAWGGTVHYVRNGKYCESDLLKYHDQYAITTNAKCAKIYTSGG